MNDYSLEQQFAEQDQSAEFNARHEKFQTAFKEVHAELVALPKEELIQINLNTETAVSKTLALEPNLHRFLESIGKLPHFDVRLVERLQLYAMALWSCTGLQDQFSRPGVSLKVLGAELRAIRRRLSADARALVEWKLLDDGSFLDALDGGVGHLAVAGDVRALGLKLRLNWGKCENRTPVTLAYVEQALDKAAQMTLAFGSRTKRSRAVQTEKEEIRVRAFTLLVRAYDEARRAIVFLRWKEGDADQIFPSLYAGKAKPKKKAKVTEPEAAAPVAVTPVAPPPSEPVAHLAPPVRTTHVLLAQNPIALAEISPSDHLLGPPE